MPQNPNNSAGEYAAADYVYGRRLTFTTTYTLPGIKGFGQLLEGWKINSIVTLQSPQPWNIFDTTNNFSGSGDKADRWDFFGNPADFKSGASSLMYCKGPNAGGDTTGGCDQ